MKNLKIREYIQKLDETTEWKYSRTIKKVKGFQDAIQKFEKKLKKATKKKNIHTDKSGKISKMNQKLFIVNN